MLGDTGLRLSRYVPMELDYIRYPWVADLTRMRDELGFEPRYHGRRDAARVCRAAGHGTLCHRPGRYGARRGSAAGYSNSAGARGSVRPPAKQPPRRKNSMTSQETPSRCLALTQAGEQCKNDAQPGTEYCSPPSTRDAPQEQAEQELVGRGDSAASWSPNSTT